MTKQLGGVRGTSASVALVASVAGVALVGLVTSLTLAAVLVTAGCGSGGRGGNRDALVLRDGDSDRDGPLFSDAALDPCRTRSGDGGACVDLHGDGGQDDLPDPVLDVCWSLDSDVSQRSGPQLVAFRDGCGLAFEATQGTRYGLSGQDAQALRFQGGFTIVAEVRLDRRPPGRGVIVSRWAASHNGRSYELGLDRTQQPYLVVSSTGKWDSGAKQVTSQRQLRLGKTNQVAAVFEPGARMEIFIDGESTRKTTGGVPESVFDADTDPLLGNRPGNEGSAGLTGVLGRVTFYDVGLSADQVAALSKIVALDDPPAGYAPVQALTKGPLFHWFGYYDKLEFDPSGRYILGQEVAFENRSPEPDDVIHVGMVDRQDGNRWIELGETRAWNWQQGCMLQWRPGSSNEVLWNDRDGDGDDAHFVTRILNVETHVLRTLPRPVYHVRSDGKWALGTDFSRISDQRPGYGYAGIPDPNAGVPAPADSTIYRINLDTGESEDIISLADIAAIPSPHGDFSDAMHRFNHIQWNPSGTRFLFFHRWRASDGAGYTRIFTANPDGSDVRLLTDESNLSHDAWMDDRTICIWSGTRGGFALFEDGVGYIRTLYTYEDGHESFLPGGKWMLADTYPDGDGNHNPYLYNLTTDEIVVLGHFYLPGSYGWGEWRVDTHPRHSPDGTKVVIDSPHEGGRQLYLIDISGIVAP
ncbi:MAG: hypothetical protein J7M25_10795 [Deltaproteobacteria bacterium]|nr:hypothetical protein [Deltaproteobacteria bacterium]